VPGPSTKKQRGDVDDVGGGWFADEEKRQEGRRQGGGEYLSSLAGLGDHVRLGPHKITQKNKIKKRRKIKAPPSVYNMSEKGIRGVVVYRRGVV
jgi:hypothetical protein